MAARARVDSGMKREWVSRTVPTLDPGSPESELTDCCSVRTLCLLCLWSSISSFVSEWVTEIRTSDWIELDKNEGRKAGRERGKPDTEKKEINSKQQLSSTEVNHWVNSIPNKEPICLQSGSEVLVVKSNKREEWEKDRPPSNTRPTSVESNPDLYGFWKDPGEVCLFAMSMKKSRKRLNPHLCL